MQEGAVYDHTGFITDDLDSTLAFWTGVMGFEAVPVVERSQAWVEGFTGVAGASLRIAHLFGLGAHLEFIEFTRAGTAATPLAVNLPATGHVCFKVPDLQRVHDAILAAGGSAAGRITTITEGKIAGSKGLYMRDPNGVLIEILQIVEEAGVRP